MRAFDPVSVSADPTVSRLAEDFRRIWEMPQFAQLLAGLMADPARRDEPCEMVLTAHRRLLVAALRREQRSGNVTSCLDADGLADVVLGVYLSRRLSGGEVGDWVPDAIAVVAVRRGDS